MGYRTLVFVSTCFMASALVAQSVPSATGKSSDSWSRPATASSAVSYRVQSTPSSKPSSSHFKFKGDQRAHAVDQPPPSAMDKASVMGLERPWQNGQAPVNCASSPHSSACKH